MGCFHDGAKQRYILNASISASKVSMTREACFSFCRTSGRETKYAGVEDAWQCFCTYCISHKHRVPLILVLAFCDISFFYKTKLVQELKTTRVLRLFLPYIWDIQLVTLRLCVTVLSVCTLGMRRFPISCMSYPLQTFVQAVIAWIQHHRRPRSGALERGTILLPVTPHANFQHPRCKCAVARETLQSRVVRLGSWNCLTFPL